MAQATALVVRTRRPLTVHLLNPDSASLSTNKAVSLFHDSLLQLIIYMGIEGLEVACQTGGDDDEGQQLLDNPVLQILLVIVGGLVELGGNSRVVLIRFFLGRRALAPEDQPGLET